MRLFSVLLFGALAASSPGAILEDLATVQDRSSHRASSYDRTGGNEDSLTSIAPGETRILLDTDGPGRITHMWFTAARFAGDEPVLRHIVLRIYWEHASVPSVEVPLGDFFGLGHGKLYTYQSLPMTVGGNPVAMNGYWPMPFYKHARVEVSNNGDRSVRRLYYNLDYELGTIPDQQGLFHAVFTRNRQLAGQSTVGNTTGKDNFVILETEGRGQYVGCTLAVDARPGGWWGEGDDMIFIDHSEKPVINGTGTEDYFCNAWGYKDPFSYPFYGAPYLENRPDNSMCAVLYRWHVPDPVRFRTHIKVTLEHCWDGQLLNDFTTVAYWYQTEPIKSRSPLPPAADNQPGLPPSPYLVDASQLEADCLARGLRARAITANHHEGYDSSGWLQIEMTTPRIDLNVPVPAPGTYKILVKPVRHVIANTVQIGIAGGELKRYDARRNAVVADGLAAPERTAGQTAVAEPDKQPNERQTPYIDLGTATITGRWLAITVGGSPLVGLDAIKLVEVHPSPQGKGK